MGIQENLALALRRGARKLLGLELETARRAGPGLVKASGPGAGGSSDIKGWTSFRWTASGSDPSDGNFLASEASAFR